jgi:hypothetical protein
MGQFSCQCTIPLCPAGKNVLEQNTSEERESPEQIPMGAMDPLFCLPLALAIHLELWTESGLGHANDHMFGLEGVHYASWEDSRYSKGERTMKVKVKSCC